MDGMVTCATKYALGIVINLIVTGQVETVHKAAKVNTMRKNVTGVFQVKREKIVQRTVLSSANSRNALRPMVLVAKDAVAILMGHIATSAILAFTGITVRAIVLMTVLI